MVANTSIAGQAYEREQASSCCSSKSNGLSRPEHPLDQLSIHEISEATRLIRQDAALKKLKFNSITLREPLKKEYVTFRDQEGPRPDRKAFAIVLEAGTCNVAEVLVNLTTNQVEWWKDVKDVMPTLTLEDLDVTEKIARNDPRVIEACKEIGLTDMSRLYLDAWAIGVDDRWGFETRLQQGLAYYRSSLNDNQYAHPLDFSVTVDTEREEVLAVDIRRVNGERTAIPIAEHNYLPEFISDQYRHDLLKPVEITQPKGVSFTMNGNVISWCGFSMHIGFNYREGIVLSDVCIDDPYEKRKRPIFNRISVAEMVVPYGEPGAPHHKKHAFDVGEYGTGFMTNSLKLGCDCKGAIQYLDGVVSTSQGEAAVIQNAICIHEEDNGLLFKHTDFRDGKVISARARKLIISQILTAANYEYALYHIFHLDGTYQFEVKLTGMLNTYCLHPSEEAGKYGTQVAERVTAHNHQHIFSLRLDSEIDGPNNTVVQCDAVASEAEVGSAENFYGNGFYCRQTPLRTAKQGAQEYCHETSRTWNITNPNVLHPVAKKPVAYKIVSRESPPLLAKPGSVVWNRAGFARKALWVTPYRDYEVFPAGDYVCQSTGADNHASNRTIIDRVAEDESIDNTDIVCYLQFGLTHFPRVEDFPIMPAEPVSVMVRASNFFERNPALWVPPSHEDQPGESILVHRSK
ncbi:amine oxidase-5 [Coleophoma crateriformis]|uniref:Amine oxidase n=1 Tax=Coleophoma crateriformis TaxID=565419 RepID=A0A3D8Q9L5_9HELO|nr:amine oxidase-5 [Coleophoma crateriformis]